MPEPDADDPRAVRDFLAAWDPHYDEQHRMLGTSWHGPGYHTRVPEGSWVYPTRTALDYALALCMTGESWRTERAADVVGSVLVLQDQEPTSRTYGIWPWLLEEPLSQMNPPDWNWADFCGVRLAELLADHMPALPDDLVDHMRTALGHAAWSVFRRNVGPSYTNIAVMGGGVAAAAGELLGEPRLLDYGRRRLRDLVEHTHYHGGFNEYNSPTYTTVVLHECERMLHLIHDQETRDHAESLRRTAWQVVAEHFHPGTAQWAGPHARAYGIRLNVAVAHYLSRRTGVEIAPHPTAASSGGESLFLGKPVPCPPELADRFSRLPAEPVEETHRFIRLDGEQGGQEEQGGFGDRCGTTWMTSDACLGSVNHDNLWTQRHVVLAYWRTEHNPAIVLRLRFLKDGVDFASALACTAQRGPRVLSAFGLLTDKGAWHPSLDRPDDGTFPAQDFRIRYELTGEGVEHERLDEHLYQLSAGRWRAVIHTLPGRFGPHELTWRLGAGDGSVHLDGVCYHGPLHNFDFTDFGETYLGVALELLTTDQTPTPESPVMHRHHDVPYLDWAAVDLRVTAPARPGTYPKPA